MKASSHSFLNRFKTTSNLFTMPGPSLALIQSMGINFHTNEIQFKIVCYYPSPVWTLKNILKTICYIGLKFSEFQFNFIWNIFANFYGSVATISVVIKFLSMRPMILLQAWKFRFCLHFWNFVLFNHWIGFYRLSWNCIITHRNMTVRWWHFWYCYDAIKMMTWS